MFRSPYSRLVAFAVLSLVGLALLPRLPVQLAPSAGGRALRVAYGWAGASPQALERQVTAKLEGALSLLAGVKKLSSVSGYGQGRITLELDATANVDATRFELAQLVRQVYPTLPPDLTYPQIAVDAPAETQRSAVLLVLQLGGPQPPGTLQRYAEDFLKPRLAGVAGVGSVVVHGGSQPEWVLTYNADALPPLQLTEADLRGAIARQFRREPLGQLRDERGQIQRVSLLNTPATYLAGGLAPPVIDWSFPLANRAGRVVRLSDLVTATRQEPPPNQFYRINGQTAINLVVGAVVGANQLTVASQLRAQLAALPLPPGYRLSVSYDSTDYIRENLRKTGIQTGVAVLVLLLFVALTTRSRRYVWLIALSTLVTLLLSAGVFVGLGVEMHLYSLAALTTSLGIVMDNVIIMIDHYRRHRNGRVFSALLGATLTTCAGLVVIWFLPEENRQALANFAVVMAVTLLVSLGVSVGFVPAVMAQFWPLSSPGAPTSGLGRRAARRWLWCERTYGRCLTCLVRFRGVVLAGAVLLFGLPIFWLPTKLPDTMPLSVWYNALIGSNLYSETIRPVADKWLGGTLRLFVNYVYEGSYQREPERTALYVVAELPNQSTPEQMDAVFRRLEADLGRYGEVEQYITEVDGGQAGNLVVYFRKPHDLGIFPYQLKNRMVLLSTEMSGIDWSIFGVGQGYSQRLNEEESPTFNVELFGYSYAELDRQANRLVRLLEAHPRIETVNVNRSPGLYQRRSLYEFALLTDPQALALRGVEAPALHTYLADLNARPRPDLYAFTATAYEAIRLLPVQSLTVDSRALQQQPIQLPNATLKLTDVATLSRQKVTPDIYRENQQYRRVVSFEYMGSYQFGEKFINKTLNALRSTLPMGYTAKLFDQQWFMTEKSQTPYALLGLVVLLIYLLCAVIFESLWQPLALVAIIPLSYVGVFLAFYLTDANFDQGGYASLVLLAGNVVCAGIFVVAEMNRLRLRYPRLSTSATYLKAFRHKVGPVLLTVLSTMVGLVPFLLYDREPFWYALGVGTIGGLLVSLGVLAVLFPVFLLKRRQVASR